tara:strand:- start:255 stop:890 length:636 start_codon:yes stop_codon:yes gene_type:complete
VEPLELMVSDESEHCIDEDLGRNRLVNSIGDPDTQTNSRKVSESLLECACANGFGLQQVGQKDHLEAASIDPSVEVTAASHTDIASLTGIGLDEVVDIVPSREMIEAEELSPEGQNEIRGITTVTPGLSVLSSGHDRMFPLHESFLFHARTDTSMEVPLSREGGKIGFYPTAVETIPGVNEKGRNGNSDESGKLNLLVTEVLPTSLSMSPT